MFAAPIRHSPGVRVRGSRMPLSPIEFDTLLEVARGTCHATLILDAIKTRSGQLHDPSPGSLYTALRSLESAGLIEATDHCRHHVHNHKQRCFVITDAGRTKARSEIQRLRTVLDTVSGAGLA